MPRRPEGLAAGRRRQGDRVRPREGQELQAEVRLPQGAHLPGRAGGGRGPPAAGRQVIAPLPPPPQHVAHAHTQTLCYYYTVRTLEAAELLSSWGFGCLKPEKIVFSAKKTSADCEKSS